MTRILTLICVSISLLSCKSSGPFGDGEAILKEVYGSSLTGFELQFEDITWSGTSGSHEFSRRDNLIVKNAQQSTVADRIEKELKRLPTKRGWDSHGSGRTGDRFLRIDFEEDSAQFYMDFIISQRGDDVEVYCLYKGVRL